MKQLLFANSVAACIAIGFCTPLFAAATVATGTAAAPPVAQKNVMTNKTAGQCLTDLRAFDNKLQKDGYWLSGSGYGYGYPIMGAYDYGYAATNQQVNAPVSGVIGYQSMRPGYDVRTLIAAANVLARDGEQSACEGVLTAAQSTYKIYVAGMHNKNAPLADLPGWRRHQIAAAKPVTAVDASVHEDQLVGTEVVNPQYEDLGSVDDFVINPQTDKISYLIIARGGLFGFDEKYVAVPWQNFKITPSSNLLVLDTTKKIMTAGPLVSHDQFSKPGQFDQESQIADAYWKAHFSTSDATKTSP